MLKFLHSINLKGFEWLQELKTYRKMPEKKLLDGL